MALATQIEFLKVLACMAWADEKVSRAEISLIGRLMHDFHLSGEERMQVTREEHPGLKVAHETS